MDHFSYRQGMLHCEQVPVSALVEAYATPLYVYSQAALLHHLRQLQEAFAPVKPLICYSLKTNGNLHLAACWPSTAAASTSPAAANCTAPWPPAVSGDKIVFAGVGKTDAEIDHRPWKTRC